MKIRNLQKEDYREVDMCMQELHTLHVKGRPDLYAPLEHPYSERDFLNIVEDGNHIAIAMVDEKDSIMGFGIASLKDKSGMIANLKTAYIDDMYIKKEYRRKGITKEIFKQIENTAKEQGAVRIDLMVWEFNESAFELYEALGMKPQRYILEKHI